MLSKLQRVSSVTPTCSVQLNYAERTTNLDTYEFYSVMPVDWEKIILKQREYAGESRECNVETNSH